MDPDEARLAYEQALRSDYRRLFDLLAADVRTSLGETWQLQITPDPYRCRWVDKLFPGIRPILWRTLGAAASDFAAQCVGAGAEEEQVGALVAKLMDAMRREAPVLERALTANGLDDRQLRIGRYIFTKREEKRWGPDFALVIIVRERGLIHLGRYVLYQAKLMPNDRLPVRREQLTSLLATSWHGSLYVAWRPNMPPRSIPANLLDEHISADREGRGLSRRTSKVPWNRLEHLTDDLADVLADRFLCGELGDPLPLNVLGPKLGAAVPGAPGAPSPAGQSPLGLEIASHLAARIGTPPGGIILFDLRAGEGPVGQPASVAIEDIVVETGEEGHGERERNPQ